MPSWIRSPRLLVAGGLLTLASGGFLYWVESQETLPQLSIPDNSAVRIYVSPPLATVQMLANVESDFDCASGARLTLSLTFIHTGAGSGRGGFAVVLTGGAEITREDPRFDRSDNLEAGTVSVAEAGAASSGEDGELFWGAVPRASIPSTLTGCMAAPVKAAGGVLTTVDLPAFGDPEIADAIALGIPAPQFTVSADDHRASRLSLDNYSVPRILEVRVAVNDPGISGPEISFDRVSPLPVAGPDSTTWTATTSVITVGLVARNVSADRIYQVLLVIAGILIGAGISLSLKAFGG